MSDIPKKLAEPFDPAIVSWRLGPTNREKTKGMALAYIDARDVMRRLDEVCGPEHWQDEYPWSDGKRVVCRIGVRIGDEWIWKTDGAGDTDTEGEKGALSDAFKRSAVKWGIGRYLYDIKSPWVEIEKRGNTFIIAEGEYGRLKACLPRPAALTQPRRQQLGQSVTSEPTPFDDPVLPPHPEEPPAARERREASVPQLNRTRTRGPYTIEMSAKPNQVEAREFGVELIAAFKGAGSMAELDQWQQLNADGMTRMGEVAPKAHASVFKALDAMREHLGRAA